MCTQTVINEFGHVSLQAVRLISKLIKSRSYNTKPAVSHTQYSYKHIESGRLRLLLAGPEKLPTPSATQCG